MDYPVNVWNSPAERVSPERIALSEFIGPLAENSHQPTRTLLATDAFIQIPRQAQRFLSAFGPIREHFHPKQHQLTPHRASPTNARLELTLGERLLG